MTRTEQIAQFVARTGYDDLPASVVRKAKDVIMDTLGCGIGTTTEDPKKAATAWGIVRQMGGPQEATNLVAGFKTPAVWAAFANGVLCHGIDFDDTHKEALTHTGAPIVPAALASAETKGLSGKDLITGVVLGYEVSVRVGMCVMPSHYRFWQSTATNCTFGAAALTAKMYGCTEEEIINALGLTGTQAAGLLTYLEFGDFSKSLNVGKCSFNGVFSGICAKTGATAPPVMLEHKMGYSYAYCPDGEPKLDKLTAGLGENYEILVNVPKPYPSLTASHAPIELVLKLMKEKGIKPEQIVKITERTYNTVKTHFSNFDPQTTMAARLSVPYCIAVAAATGTCGVAQFTMDVINDPKVRQMLSKVEIIADPELNKLYPEKFPAVIDIETADGKTYHGEQYYPGGDVMNPISLDGLKHKFRGLAAPSFSAGRVEEIINAVDRLEDCKDVRDFTKLLVK